MNVLLLCLVAVALVSADKENCEKKCAKCPTIERGSCLAGVQKDGECQCCDVCSRFEGQKCDLKDAPFKHGQCGDGLECRTTEGGDICQCVWHEMVCGSNGQDYFNLCQLMASAVREGLQDTLEVSHIGPCEKEAKIVSPPKYVKNATNENVVLSCEAVGDPVPSIKWEVTKANGNVYEMPECLFFALHLFAVL
ncbi:insulin-like growth factor-binding protein-related protein 1 [Plakobranchus ocellatus]|uniref:Insulin-like growth factor-binding protein-related protein 1 n=1 Tax=Plakobranchus ocellatus TaxID=259542 RepID=A0AAV4CKW0_9GAST|nr:insulin-like growth factor-binding protein-related protein 1 [Plakobranchus ocellatus]